MKQRIKKQILLLLSTAALTACASVAPYFGVGNAEKEKTAKISNPFNTQLTEPTTKVRAQKGSDVVEYEIPRSDDQYNSYEMSSTAALSASDSPFAQAEATPQEFRKPTLSDYEIMAKAPKNSLESETDRREIEQGLGLESRDEPVESDRSYLAEVDGVKQLFRSSRFEAALLKVDELITLFPNQSQLYVMRGTLLERLGHADLAIKSWKQALRFDANNTRLKRVIEMREKRRGIASGGQP